MAIIFSPGEGGSLVLRKGLYRMVLRRARRFVSLDSDIDQLQDWNEGISLSRMEPDERARIGDALLRGALSMRADVAANRPTEEPVREGAESYLTELIAFLTHHLDPE